jgi:hypothetical protein
MEIQIILSIVTVISETAFCRACGLDINFRTVF